MEQSKIPVTTAEHSSTEKTARPFFALEMEDIGDLDKVLRSYYLSQIKKIEKRKDRKLARQLLENHLILPKSKNRTSKDSAYIKEILGIDFGLLERLEESRLIRRIHKRGSNPIYEISHDTLVEPILAEKRDREVITRFIKRAWKYLILLLLLWFLFGMLFENSFEVIPDIAQEPKSIGITMEEQVLEIGDNPASFQLPLPPIIIDQKLKPSDTILIKLPIDPVNLTSFRTDEETDSDTITIKLGSPIDVPVGAEDLPITYQTFSDVVVPLAYTNRDSANPNANQIFAKLSGNLRMTSEAGAREGTGTFDRPLEPIEMTLGDTILQAKSSAQSVPVNFSLRLTDFFMNENDKNRIRNTLGDPQVNLNYNIQVEPTPIPPPPQQIALPSVQGIEVQYSDGTTKFIPGDATSIASGTETIHIVAAGETLFSIAKQYGVVDENGKISTEVIKKLNGLRDNSIAVGQALRIPIQ